MALKSRGPGVRNGDAAGAEENAEEAVNVSIRCSSPQTLSSSTSRQSDCSSRTSTLNDSGRPGSSGTSPLTMAS